MRKQIDSVNAELNETIDNLTGEIKQVSTEINKETGKVQTNEKKPGEKQTIDCKGLLQELMALMWTEVNGARQAAKDQREMLMALKEAMAELKAENEQMRQAAADSRQMLKEAMKEAEEARTSTIKVTRRAEAAEKQAADFKKELELEKSRAASAGALGEQVADLQRERDESRARQADLEAQLAVAIRERDEAIAKLDAYMGAQMELEDMRKTLEAEMEAVRSLPMTPCHGRPLTTGVAFPWPRLPAYHGRCSAQVKREMRKQIDSVQSELNQQIDALTGEIKQVSTEIKSETGKVQPAKKTGGKGDCKALLLELMAIMWQEINAARQVAKDERTRSGTNVTEIASLKVKVDSLEESMRLLQEHLVAAERERDHIKHRLDLASTDMAGHMKAEKQRLEGLIVAVCCRPARLAVSRCTSSCTSPCTFSLSCYRHAITQHSGRQK